MKTFIMLVALFLLSTCAMGKGSEMPIIKIYYDNTSVRKGVEPSWGFSALVKYNGNLLFDTGGDAKILAANMKRMGSEPEHIENIVISHAHWDHLGGLTAILNEKQIVYFLKSFPKDLKNAVRKYELKRFVEIDEPLEILPDVYTTGEMGKEIKEQALILDTKKGLVIITGCAHPGIVNIVRKAKKMLEKNVYLVIGGFHLYDMSTEDVQKIIDELKSLGVKKVAPCHCTGEKAIAIFKQEFKKDFIKVGAGSIINL